MPITTPEGPSSGSSKPNPPVEKPTTQPRESGSSTNTPQTSPTSPSSTNPSSTPKK